VWVRAAPALGPTPHCSASVGYGERVPRLRYSGEPIKNDPKHYAAAKKVAILKRHLLEKVPVSQLCEEKGLQPTVFYHWQKEFLENGANDRTIFLRLPVSC